MTRQAVGGATDFGVGVSLGQPGGISMYLPTTDSQWVQAALVFDADLDPGISADYAFGYPRLFDATPEITPYIGVGAFVFDRYHDIGWEDEVDRTEEGAYVAARIPLGVLANLERTPVQLGLEVAPAITLQTPTYRFVQSAVFARYLM
jgi:hypothetical protein